ncbi:MAG: PolC-type DNA polymerase III [Selenomonadales bacterium]|nr:PolC-type DNA polymerase III [Selenomonadales bacterium]MEE1361230.1 PolC-type DNA polymerase III [Selenomonadaceae bacterium]
MAANKYCIIPKASNAFWDLVKDMHMTPDEEGFLQGGKIRHVEITPDTNSWEIMLWSCPAISAPLLSRAGQHIKNKCKVNDVIFYQTEPALEEMLERNWGRITDYLSRNLPSIRHVLLHSRRILNGHKVLLQVQGDFAVRVLTDNGIDRMLETTCEKVFGYPVQFDYQAVFDDLPVWADTETVTPEKYQRFQAEHAKEVSKQAKSSAPAPASNYSNTSEGGGFTPNAGNANSNKGSRRRGPVISDDPDSPLLMGKDVSGDILPISEAVGEMRNVVLQGIIGSLDGKNFQATNLITFALADDTNGISCKVFLKDIKDFETLMGYLKGCNKSNATLKVKGSLRFDRYDGDVVMMADSIYKVKLHQREDLAEEKRVELHCHTVMSTMDGVSTATNIIKTAARWGWDAIAITDHGVVQAYPEAMDAVKKLDIKVIYGMEGYLTGDDWQQQKTNHIILLAKNPIGLRNLYKMVSWSHLRFFHRRPRLPRRLIEEYREGVIVGSACEAGELIRAIVAGASDDELLKIAEFYDFLEIQPIMNNEFLIRSNRYPDINTEQDLININLKVAELAKKLNKPLIATCDVHFLNPEDQIYRAILMKGNGFEDADLQPPLYLRTTEEMLAEFQYLGEEEAYKAVVTNTRMIADQVEKFKPIPDGLYSPMIPGADEDITNMTYHNAKRLYGENLPKVVQDRIDLELKPIIHHGFAVLYLIAHKLVKKSNIDGYLVGSRGSVGSSFVATMTDITEVNPLPPHWRCPHCKNSEFVEDGSYGCGYDLPDKTCPICGTNMVKDGHDIPFAVFLGFDGDKVPDIDLNFSGVYQPVAHKYCEELFGKDNVFKAGSITTVAEKTAYGYVRKYYEEKGQHKREAFINKVAKGCNGVKRTTGQHPAGIMVVPRNMDVHFFTPLQHPADDIHSSITTTHFDYHSISSRLVKLDILGHDDPTVIKMLEDLTHRDPKTIPFDDPVTLSLFSSTTALGVTPEELGATSGTFGIPEFRTNFTRQMIDDTHPNCFSDLVRISGFSHGTDVWLGNAQDLIRGGTCTLKDAISARDDIMMYLIHKGVDPLLSFKTMENVRKGKGIAPDVVEKLREHKIPEWYIESCQKIKYMFPRAHATAYVMMAYRIAFCKVHYPLAYYAAYFSIRAEAFDSDVIAQGKSVVKQNMDDLNAKDKLEPKEAEFLVVLQLAWEMYIRGYTVEKVDLYRSEADKFVMLEKSLLPPFTSLKGVGGVDAAALVAGREGPAFSSIENMRKRTGISKTAIEALRNHGCLEGMEESDQIALFA